MKNCFYDVDGNKFDVWSELSPTFKNTRSKPIERSRKSDYTNFLRQSFWRWKFVGFIQEVCQ